VLSVGVMLDLFEGASVAKKQASSFCILWEHIKESGNVLHDCQ
jgi:hypothetical protein